MLLSDIQSTRDLLFSFSEPCSPVSNNPANAAGHHQNNHNHGRDCRKSPFIPPGEFAEPIRCRRGAGFDRFILQVALDIGREAVGRFVPPGAVLLQGLHHDPVQLAAERVRQLPRIDATLFGDG